MASNVFGNPITDSTLEGMPEYANKVITRKDRARVALAMKNALEKDMHARYYVEELKKKSGDGVATECLVYNATGDTVRLVLTHDWFGNIGQSPYPVQIANGQWGVFLHVKTSGPPSGSVGAVVFRGMNQDNSSCDWMLAWSNPWNRLLYDNKVYSEIREAHHYETDHWDYIHNLMEGCGKQHSDTWNGCVSTVASGTGTTVLFEGVMTLEGL